MKDDILEYRKLIKTEGKNSEKAKKLKNRQRGILTSGVFSDTKDHSLLSQSGLVAIDIDGIDGKDRENLQKLKHSLVDSFDWVYAVYESISENLKVIVKYEVMDEYDKGIHKAVFSEFANDIREFIESYRDVWTDIVVDMSGQNLARKNLFSYDPAMVLNKDCIARNVKIEEAVMDGSRRKVMKNKELEERVMADEEVNQDSVFRVEGRFYVKPEISENIIKKYIEKAKTIISESMLGGDSEHLGRYEARKEAAKILSNVVPTYLTFEGGWKRIESTVRDNTTDLYRAKKEIFDAITHFNQEYQSLIRKNLTKDFSEISKKERVIKVIDSWHDLPDWQIDYKTFKILQFGTDLDVAQLLFKRYGNYFRQIDETENFISYKNYKWVESKNSKYFSNSITNLILSIFNFYIDIEIQKNSDESDAENAQLEKLNKRFEYLKKINVRNRILTDFFTKATISKEDMEPRSHEIKFSNGIYNLKANQYIPAEDLSPIDNLSIQTVGYEYDATASCERIQQFIYEIASGEEEKAEILFDIAALALIDESPQFLFFLLGNGANGKSLYLKLLAMLAGGSKGYQFQLEKDVLSDGKYINKMPYLDKLQYKRLITTSELNKNQIIDATLIKSLTGGDIVTARANYAEPSNFQFYGSIVIAGNSFPEFDDKSYGLERRVVLIPFLENFLNIPIENQKSTKDFEKIFRAELPGFFNFLLERIIKFYKNISDFSVLDDFKYSENNTISKQFIISKVDDIKAGKTELKSAVEDLIDANFFSNANSKIALKEFLSTINNDLESVIDRKACLDILDELGYEVRRSSGNQEFVFGLQMKQMSMFEDENSCDKLVISDDTILSIAKNKSRTRINKFKKIGRNI